MKINKLSFSTLLMCFVMMFFVQACTDANTSETEEVEDTEEVHDHDGHDHDHEDEAHDHDDHDGHDHDETSGITTEQGANYTSAYVCPMHCPDSGSDEAGTCPTCGMAYVALADHESDGHTHE